MNYYKRHLGDYAKKTRTLTTYEHGVYNLLLDLYYSEEAPLSEDDAVAVCRASTKAERQSVSRVLERFFENVDGRWHNSRADEEVANYREKAEKNAAIGSLGGKQKAKRNASETLSEPAEDRQANGNPSHKPLATSQEKANPPTPSGVARGERFEEFWTAYPRKVGKPKASASWERLPAADRDKAIASIPAHAASPQWVKDAGQFIPHPATWLNQRRFDDDLGPAKTGNGHDPAPPLGWGRDPDGTLYRKLDLEAMERALD